MCDKIKSIVQQAFSVFARLHGLPSATNSDSTRSTQQQSYLSGSYAVVSPNSTLQRNSSSASRASAVGDQVLPMGLQGSPSASQMMPVVRNHHSRNMAPPAYISMQQVPQSSFVQGSMGMGLQTQQPPPQGFMPNNVAVFGASPFDDNSLNPGSDWFQVNYDIANTGATFNVNNAASDFVSHSGGSIHEPMIAPTGSQAMARWDTVHGPRGIQYNPQP